MVNIISFKNHVDKNAVLNNGHLGYRNLEHNLENNKLDYNNFGRERPCCSIQDYNKLHKQSIVKDAISMIRDVRIAKSRLQK